MNKRIAVTTSKNLTCDDCKSEHLAAKGASDFSRQLHGFVVWQNCYDNDHKKKAEESN